MKKQNSDSAKCRHCDAPLRSIFADLGMSPLANSYVNPIDLSKGEHFLPLLVYTCEKCLLVQLEEFESPETIFSDYSYFSSYSSSWLKHCKNYVEHISEKLSLGHDDLVIELASNDGYLLQYFLEKNIPVLGIEPAANVAEVAKEKGIDTLVEFFGAEVGFRVAKDKKKADLILGNNVLAHVPDINDFVRGIKNLLNDDGIFTIEFPHLLNIFKNNQFDTIYHEHFSYLSLIVVNNIFNSIGLKIFDVLELPTHGGSLRVYGTHVNSTKWELSENVGRLLDVEASAGLDSILAYEEYKKQIVNVKNKLMEFLIDTQRKGKKVACYGAAAKGVTLLNYCGVGQEYIDYVIDKSPYKQDHYLPGVRIPIYGPECIVEKKPDVIIILPWNLKDEISAELEYTKEWGCELYVPIPHLQKV